MFTKLILTLIFLFASVTAFATVLPTPIITGASVSDTNGNYIFQLLFDHTPNFAQHNEYGLQAESFQFFVTDDPVNLPMNPYVADYIVRGDGIGDGIKVCSTRPYGSGCPSGWGLDLGDFSYSLQNLTLTLSIPDAVFDTAMLYYDVISLDYGKQQDWFDGTVGPVVAKRVAPMCPPFETCAYGNIELPPGIKPPVTIRNTPEAVSEPSSLALLVPSVGLLAFLRKSRAK